MAVLAIADVIASTAVRPLLRFIALGIEAEVLQQHRRGAEFVATEAVCFRALGPTANSLIGFTIARLMLNPP